jgi:hypothetical protein
MCNIEQIAGHGSYHFSVSTNQLPAHFSAPGALCGKVVKNTRIAATLRVTPFHREEQRPTSCNSGMDPVFRYQEGRRGDRGITPLASLAQPMAARRRD